MPICVLIGILMRRHEYVDSLVRPASEWLSMALSVLFAVAMGEVMSVVRPDAQRR